MLSFAQEKTNEKVLNKIVPSSLSISEYENSRAAYCVDGEWVYGDVLPRMSPDDIARITVIATAEEYPSGKVEIILKKQKET